MEKVVDYTIVMEGVDDIKGFEDEVKDKLADGWHPLGAPFHGGKDWSYLMQALIKYEK